MVREGIIESYSRAILHSRASLHTADHSPAASLPAGDLFAGWLGGGAGSHYSPLCGGVPPPSAIRRRDAAAGARRPGEPVFATTTALWAALSASRLVRRRRRAIRQSGTSARQHCGVARACSAEIPYHLASVYDVDRRRRRLADDFASSERRRRQPGCLPERAT
jgi:hypothetical protein